MEIHPLKFHTHMLLKTYAINIKGMLLKSNIYLIKVIVEVVIDMLKFSNFIYNNHSFDKPL